MADKKKKDKKWIQGMDMKEGAFTAKAKRKGITSAQLQANVLANPDQYDEKTVKQARLRKTLVGLKKTKDGKKEG
jgi:predicted double-glycine peptidase